MIAAGGAIYTQNGSFAATNCQFHQNQVLISVAGGEVSPVGFGGAVDLHHSSSEQTTLDNCIFAANSVNVISRGGGFGVRLHPRAYAGGLDVRNVRGAVTLANCVFRGNIVNATAVDEAAIDSTTLVPLLISFRGGIFCFTSIQLT